MFNEPGGKLKRVAIFVFVLGLILSLVGAYYTYNFMVSLDEFNESSHTSHYWELQKPAEKEINGEALVVAGMVTIVGGVVSYIISLFIMGFAQLVEDNQEQRQLLWQIQTDAIKHYTLQKRDK